MHERIAELCADCFQLLFQVTLALARYKLNVRKFANLTRLFVLGLLVTRQEIAELLVISLFRLFNRQHGGQFRLEAQQVRLQFLLVFDELKRLLKEDLEVALLHIFVQFKSIAQMLNLLHCLHFDLHLTQLFR